MRRRKPTPAEVRAALELHRPSRGTARDRPSRTSGAGEGAAKANEAEEPEGDVEAAEARKEGSGHA